MTIAKKSSVVFTICVVASYLCVQLVSLLVPGAFCVWNSQVHDGYYRARHAIRGSMEAHPDIVHVDIDDTSYEIIGRERLMQRGTYAQLIEVLGKAGCRAVLSDVAFWGSAGRRDDEALVAAARRFGGLYLPLIVRMHPQVMGSVANIEIDGKYLIDPIVDNAGSIPSVAGCKPNYGIINEVAAGGGHIASVPDGDGVHRRFQMLIRYGEMFVPSISLRLACDYLGVDTEKIVVDAGSHILLPDVELANGDMGDIRIPISEDGSAVVNFMGLWGESVSHYPAHGLLAALGDDDAIDELAEVMDGALVIMSDVSTVAQDIGAVPLEEEYPKAGLHSSVLNSILMQQFVRDAGLVNTLLRDAAIVAITLLAAWNIGAVGCGTVMVLLLVANYYLGMYLFVDRSILMSVVQISMFQVFAGFLVIGSKYFIAEREKSLLMRRFESYMAPPVLAKVLKSPGLVADFQRKDLTMMFTDVCSFTPWCSGQSPSEIHRTLTEYFDEMTKIVFKHEGTVDKYIGDGLMVFFGDPVDQEDHALRAVNAAIDMQVRARELKEKWSAEGRLKLKIRIGINTGDVAVGNLGSAGRMEYTALGSNVNIAQRLESEAPAEGILISESTHDAIDGAVRTKSHGAIEVKGLDEKLNVFEVVLLERAEY